MERDDLFHCVIPPLRTFRFHPSETRIVHRHVGRGAGEFQKRDQLPLSFLRNLFECGKPVSRVGVAKQCDRSIRLSVPKEAGMGSGFTKFAIHPEFDSGLDSGN